MPTPIEGRNSGAAVVYGANKAIDTFGRLMAQRQAERDAEQKQLASQLANLNTNGLREYDKDDYYKAYDQWRTQKQKAYGLKGQAKFNADAEADKLYAGLNELVYNSKEGANQDRILGLDMIKDADKYSDEFKNAYHKSVKAPLSHADRVKDYTLLPMERDLSKVPEIFNKINTELLSKAKESNPTQLAFKGGNRTGTILQYDTAVDPQAQALAYAELFDLDKSVSYAARKANPDLPWNENPVAAKAQWVAEMVQQNPLIKTRSTAPVLDLVDNYERNLKLRNKYWVDHSGSGAGTLEAPKDATLSYGPSGEHKVTGKGTVAIRKTTQSFQGAPAYDLEEATFTTITEPTSKYEVVSIGNYPVAKGDFQWQNKGQPLQKAKAGSVVGDDFAKNNPDKVQWKSKLLVADPDGGAYLIDPNYWPKNNMTKKDDAILSTFKSYQPGNTPVKAAPAKKVEDLRNKYKY